jgi:hypothetical protein
MSYSRPIEMSEYAPRSVIREADDYGLVLMSGRELQRIEVLSEVLAGDVVRFLPRRFWVEPQTTLRRRTSSRPAA